MGKNWSFSFREEVEILGLWLDRLPVDRLLGETFRALGMIELMYKQLLITVLVHFTTVV